MQVDTTILTKEVILSFLSAHQLKLQSFGVKKIGLFGSFVRDEQHAESDLDFLVEYQPGRKSLKNYFDLMDWLESVFQREIELVTKESLSPYIGPHIEREVAYVPLSS